jgi:hypothetical protein
MSSHRNAIKRQKRAVKIITRSVEAKLTVERKAMGEPEYQAQQQLKSFIANRPMGNY